MTVLAALLPRATANCVLDSLKRGQNCRLGTVVVSGMDSFYCVAAAEVFSTMW